MSTLLKGSNLSRIRGILSGLNSQLPLSLRCLISQTVSLVLELFHKTDIRHDVCSVGCNIKFSVNFPRLVEKEEFTQWETEEGVV